MKFVYVQAVCVTISVKFFDHCENLEIQLVRDMSLDLRFPRRPKQKRQRPMLACHITSFIAVSPPVISMNTEVEHMHIITSELSSHVQFRCHFVFRHLINKPELKTAR